MAHGILLISCPDQKGITAAVTGFVAEHQGNIVDVEQHIDETSGVFFMRIEWDLKGFDLDRAQIAPVFDALAQQYAMICQLFFTDEPMRLALFVSRHLHCLHDILYRQRTGQLPCIIPLVISNHAEAQPLVEEHGAVFVHVPITPDNKKEQEQQQLTLLKAHQIDVIGLARYHQILTGDFIQHYPNQIINIHHSFLPSFVGQRPYAQAFDKGVKIIGATSHYVIEALDQGPIIEQDVARISHKEGVDDLQRIGEDVERAVFASALRAHLEHRVLCYGSKTVVFG